MSDSHLVFADACRELHISPSTGRRLLNAGKFPVPVIPISPRRKLVGRAALDEYMRTGQPIKSVSA